MEDYVSDMHAFGAGYKEPRVTPRWVWMIPEHHWSMKSSLQKSQDHASNVVNHTFRTDAQKQRSLK